MRAFLIGMPVATSLFDFYYDANKPESSSFNLPLDFHEKVVNMVPRIDADPTSPYSAHDGEDLIKYCLDKLINQALKRCSDDPSQLGVKHEYREGWVPARKIYADDDIANALGGFWMGVGADITIHESKPHDYGNKRTAEISYIPYIWDRYYFHGTAEYDWMELGAGWSADKYLRYSEECGHAKAFYTRGSAYVVNLTSLVGPDR